MVVSTSLSGVVLLLLAAFSSCQAEDLRALAALNTTAINATLPEATNKQTGVLLPNPYSPPCQVGVELKITNTTVALQNPRQPTASPVPSVVEGHLSLEIANIADRALQASYTVTVEVPFGTIFSNVSGGVQGSPFVGENSTLAVNFTATASLLPNAGNTSFIRMTVFASSQDFSPRVIKINGNKCAIGLATNISAPLPPLPQGDSSANLSTFVQTGYVTTSGNRIIGVDGNPITLNGANWFGFETQANMVDGLYAGDSSLTADFATVAYRIQLLGFNAIRLPFSFVVLFQSTPTVYTRNCGVSSQDDIRNNVIDPRDAGSIPGDAQPPPIVAPPGSYGSGVCNDYVPNDSVYTRFLYVIGYLARQGFYILIDNHANTDPTVVNNPGTWVAQWTQLMTDITQDPISKARVMVDVLNEPDSRSLTWENMRPLYLDVMDAIYEFSPTTLFFIEGCTQYPIAMNWGDGFVTDGGVIQQYGVSDPRPFFDDVLQRPYLDNVVISPHYYGPSVSQNQDRYTGADLAYRASTSWGYLNTVGYGGHVFPVVIGETGSQFILQSDLDFYRDLALYLNNEGALNDGRHTITRDVFWWSWNSNSGDTGGLVDTTWINVIWNKTEYLETTIGLTPWSLLAANGQSPTPTTTPTPPVESPPPPPPVPQETSPPEETPPPPSETPSPPSETPSPPSETPSPPSETPSPPSETPSPPSETPSPTEPVVTQTPPTLPEPVVTEPPPPELTVQPPPTSAGSCAYSASVDSTWQQDSGTFAVLNVFLSNSGPDAISTPYAVTISSSAYTSLESTWNWQASYSSSGTISGSSDANSDWETLSANNGNSVNLGGIVGTTTSDVGSLTPQSVTVNGQECTASS